MNKVKAKLQGVMKKGILIIFKYNNKISLPIQVKIKIRQLILAMDLVVLFYSNNKKEKFGINQEI